jgi:hypothetical protein
MLHDAFDQPFAQAPAALIRKHEHVAQIGVGCEVGNNAGEAYLAAGSVDSEAERMGNRSCHDILWNPSGPVTPGEKAVDEIEIETRRIGAHEEASLAPLFCPLSISGAFLFFLLAHSPRQLSFARARNPLTSGDSRIFDGRNFLDAALVTSAGERRTQPAVNDFERLSFVEQARPHGEHVGVIVLATQLGLNF